MVDCGPPPDQNKTHANWSQHLPHTLAPMGCSFRCLPVSVQCLKYFPPFRAGSSNTPTPKLQPSCKGDWHASASMNITASLMKYNMARGYLWWAHARCTPLRNYAMQQIWCKGGLLRKGREVRTADKKGPPDILALSPFSTHGPPLSPPLPPLSVLMALLPTCLHSFPWS